MSTTKKKPAKKRVKAGTSKMSAADRRKAFVESFLSNGGNATEAALKAGFSPNSADRQGARLLKDVRISSELAQRRTEIAQKLELTTERVLLEVARLALFDPRRLFDNTGQPIPIQDLDDDTAAALAGLDIHEEYSGHGKDRVFVGYTKKYKIADKNSALEKAAKFLGLFEKDNKQKTDPLRDLLGALSGNVVGVVKQTETEG